MFGLFCPPTVGDYMIPVSCRVCGIVFKIPARSHVCTPVCGGCKSMQREQKSKPHYKYNWKLGKAERVD